MYIGPGAAVLRLLREGLSPLVRQACRADRVPRKVIEWALRRQRIPERLIAAVMQLYVATKSRVRTTGLSEEFGIGMGVHQGSLLSPLLLYVYRPRSGGATPTPRGPLSIRPPGLPR